MKWTLIAAALAAVVAAVAAALVLGLGRDEAHAPNRVKPTVSSEVVPFTPTVDQDGSSDDASDNGASHENENEGGSDSENENDNGD